MARRRAGLAITAPREGDLATSGAGKKVTRRRLLGGSTHADVVIVGGGLSGLAAARSVVRAGRSAIVVEARRRVGGRTYNHPIGGGKVIEAGGEWVGPTQDRVHALMAELGLTTFPEYVDGNHIYAFEGTRMTYTESGPTGSAPPDPLVLPDLAATIEQLDTLSQSVPVDAPWTAPRAAEWDQQTLETWLRANTTSERFRNLARLAVRSIFGAE